MTPDILNALQDAKGGKLPCPGVTIDMKLPDESGYVRKLYALLGTMKKEHVSGERASMSIKQVFAVFRAGLRENGSERWTGLQPECGDVRFRDHGSTPSMA